MEITINDSNINDYTQIKIIRFFRRFIEGYEKKKLEKHNEITEMERV